VNLPQSAMLLTTSKDSEGDFVVDAVASDGGSHPRNINIESTMALVRFGALSPIEMAVKLSWNPSRMFGLINKGHFSEGADADITIIDPDQGKAIATYVSGDPVLMNEEIHSKEGTLLVTQAGITTAKNSGLDYEVLDLDKSKLYEGF
jgi:N-acyl-D-aspartate/D-glutamate deacylase